MRIQGLFFCRVFLVSYKENLLFILSSIRFFSSQFFLVKKALSGGNSEYPAGYWISGFQNDKLDQKVYFQNILALSKGTRLLGHAVDQY